MRALSNRFVLGLVTLLTAVAVSGCGPNFGSMGQYFQNPFGFGICGIIYAVLNVIAMLEIARSSRDMTSKVLWILALWFLPFVGLIAYYLVGRR